MRTFELALVAVIGFAVLWPAVVGRRLKRGRTAIPLLAAVVAQPVMEGYRWQLWPLSLVAIGLAVGDIGWEERRLPGAQRLRRGLFGSMGVALAITPALLLPVPVLPPPAGGFAVGTQSFVVVDAERPEPYEPTAGAPRRVMVQAWYPALAPSDTDPVTPWTPDLDVVGPAMARRLGFPGFFLSHTRYAPSHSFASAPPLSGRFPVIIYSHGWTGFRTIALNQMESLASKGYLVIAIDHTHGAIATRFPDGDIQMLDQAALPEVEAVGEEDYQDAIELLVDTFSGDIIRVIDVLAEGEDGSMGSVASHADLTRIGIYGHSTGGGAAVRTCLIDDRCDAVAGLDAWVEPIDRRDVAKELGVPSLFFRSDGWRGTPNDGLLRGIAERSPSSSYWLGLRGAGHNDYVVTPLFSPVAARLGLKGPIPADRVIPILDDYLTGFFDRELLDVGGAILSDPPPPEVEFEFIP